MAIRIVNTKGVADTQAELLASTQADLVVVYCIDTQITYTSFNGNFLPGDTIGVEDDITVIPTITNYIIDTANAGKDIIITLPQTLPEGIRFFFKRSDNSTSVTYKITFDFNGIFCDRDINNDNELLKNDYDGISLIYWGSNWSLK